MRAGLLRDRVEVQRIARTRDAIGGTIESWETTVVLWGGVRPLRGDESVDAAKQSASLAYAVTLRCQGPPTIGPGDRLRLTDGRILQVASVVDVDRRRSRLELACTERPAIGA